MKSDGTALPAFLGNAGAAKASSSSSTPRNDSGSGDDFAKLMRKNDARDAASDKPAGKPASSASEATRRQDRAAAQAQARADAKERLPATSEATSDAAAQTQATASTATAPASRQSEQHDETLPGDWPPAGLILPHLLLEPLNTPTPNAFAAAGDVLLGGAANTALPGVLQLPPWAGVMSADASSASMPLTDALPSADASVSADDATATAGTATNREGKLALPPLPAASTMTSPVASLLTPAADGATLLPAGLALFKDTLESFTAGKREDVSAAAATFALTGTTAPSDNGLARTATVNPLTSLTPDLNTDQFGETLGTQLTYMAHEKIGHAHLRISPHDLGTIEVNLTLDGDRVHADFSSPQADVRQALEQSLPKLRELLSAQGFQLAQADVGHRQSNPQSSPSPEFAQRGRHEGAASGSADSNAMAPAVRVVRGLLDAYA